LFKVKAPGMHCHESNFFWSDVVHQAYNNIALVFGVVGDLTIFAAVQKIIYAIVSGLKHVSTELSEPYENANHDRVIKIREVQGVVWWEVLPKKPTRDISRGALFNGSVRTESGYHPAFYSVLGAVQNRVVI